ncbi:MAG: hypothetical protein NC299_12185 [Lachnospiraceae bacterium]|nr:hypothetical protein [Ruminococcus sp.]MCM1276100.1 hypothetical protein [Lachnospiraceae bacterium]
MINSTGFVGECAPAVGARTGAAADEDNAAVFAEVMEHMLKAVASMGEGSESIWEIVLRLEKHADAELSGGGVSYRSGLDGVDYNAASELAAIELKRKKRKSA